MFGACLAYELLFRLYNHVYALYFVQHNALGAISTVVMVLAVFVLIYLWYESSTTEFNYINRWCSLKHTAPRSNLGEVSLAAIVALVLGGLIYAVMEPIAFASLFTAYSLIDTMMQGFLRKHLFKNFEASINEIDADLELAREAGDKRMERRLEAHQLAVHGLHRYYDNPQQDIRRWTIACVSLLILIMMLWNHRQVPKDPYFEYCALLGYVAIIASTEIIMYRFRIPLHDDIEAAEQAFKPPISRQAHRIPQRSE